jgi:hypothetical protein
MGRDPWRLSELLQSLYLQLFIKVRYAFPRGAWERVNSAVDSSSVCIPTQSMGTSGSCRHMQQSARSVGMRQTPSKTFLTKI